jgi:S1-C subfamily serine protease
MRTLILVLATVFIGGCGIGFEYNKSGQFLAVENTYKYVAIAPATNRDYVQALTNNIRGKGYVLIPPSMITSRDISGFTMDVIMMECQEAGTNSRAALGYSQIVDCSGNDANSNELVYQGTGEFMGDFRADDIKGATKLALDALPSVSGTGRTITFAEFREIANLSAPQKRANSGRSDSDDHVPAPEQTKSQGTGFFISQSGHFVTNAHVVDNCQTYKIIPKYNIVEDAVLLAKDDVNDLAVLQINKAPVNVAKLSLKLRQGEFVATFGFPLSGALSESGVFTDGTVSALSGLNNDSRFIQFSAPVQPGNSGGALVSSNGSVVGVVSSKLNTIAVANAIGDVPQNVNFALKSSTLITFLSSHGVSPSIAEGTRKMDTADLSEYIGTFSAKVVCN